MNGPSRPQRAHSSTTGWNPSSDSSFQKKAVLTTGDGCSASVRRARSSIRYSAGLASRSSATWSTASSIETAWVRQP